jgi:hypothetical protein
MTKAEEIEILRTAAQQLGPNSYLGPYIADQIPYLEEMIRQDIFPISFEAMTTLCKERIDEVTQWEQRKIKEKNDEIERAKRHAAQIIQDARDAAETIRTRARRAVLAAIGED